jgi:NADPH:quinone reductase-like Zn-dependent oxidoreductase
MKVVRYEQTGIPEEVIACVEMPDPGPPGPGDIVADIEAFPINPADVHQLTGASAREPGPLGQKASAGLLLSVLVSMTLPSATVLCF